MVDATLSVAWQLALSQERVIHGALKKERVWRRNDYWADFLQEGRLVYVQAYQRYHHEQAEFDLEKFNVYAFQAVRWHIRNLLNRDRWLKDRSLVQIDQTATDQLTDLQTDFPHRALALKQCLAQADRVWSPRQQVVWRQHFLQGRTLTDLAADLKVTSRTLRHDRQKILAYFDENLPQQKGF